MGDKYQFSISKRRRPSLWTKMMSKQGVQFRAADLLTMSPSKGPKMPLHTLMGLQVHLAYVLHRFCAPTSYFLHFPPKTAFVRTFPCTFCSARFSWLVENCATYVDPRCQAASLLDVTAWQSFHSWMCKLYMDITSWQSTWMSPFPVSTPPYNCQALLAMPRPRFY